MATDWSEAAKAKRSASAKKAAETRKANRESQAAKKAEIYRKKDCGLKPMQAHSYFQNSRVARWALSNVSVLAMMRGASYIRWGRPTDLFERG